LLSGSTAATSTCGAPTTPWSTGADRTVGFPKIDPLIAMFNEVALTAMKSHAGGIGNGIVLEGA
jgi:hypothetical protein